MSDDIAYCTRGCLRWDRHLPTCAKTDLHADDCDQVGCRGCHDDLCNGCEPRHAEHGILCRNCYRKLETLLAPADNRESIAGVCAWLSDNLGQHIASKAAAPTGRSANPGERLVTIMVPLRDLQVSLIEFAGEFISDRGMTPLEDTDPAHVADRLRPWLDTLAAWEPIGDTLEHFIALRAQAHGICPWRGRHPDASDEAAVLLWGIPPETTDQICERFRVTRQWLKDARRRKGLEPVGEDSKPYRWLPWDVYAVMHPAAAEDYAARMARAAERRGDKVVWSSEGDGLQRGA